jgi:hypothetical protein
MPREERLFDLLWQLRFCARQSIPLGQDRASSVEREIQTHAERIFDRPIDRRDLDWLVEHGLYHAPSLRDAGFPHGPKPEPPDPRRRLLRDFLTDRELFTRGRETVWVNPQSEGVLLSALQVALRRLVGAHGIFVEINPTSNLLIGDLGDLVTHPLWRLRPPRPDPHVPPVSICVGSDDPVTFATNLREEYQWLCDGLKAAGLSDEEAHVWLDRTRSCGLEARFTLPFRTANRAVTSISQPAPFEADLLA